MQPVKIGSFEITRVEEMIWTISPRFLFPDLTYQDFEPHRDWLVPHFSAEGRSQTAPQYPHLCGAHTASHDSGGYVYWQ